jgi:hypothetical protein
MSLEIKPYSAGYRDIWNDFVAQAKNGHFLFDRGYMEYHSERFFDASVLVFQGDKLVAVMPANLAQDAVYSHQGLTFGGLVLSDRWMTTPLAISALGEIGRHYHASGARRLVYRALPHAYHIRPAEEDLYALFRLGAQLTRVDISTTVDLQERGRISERRKRGTKRAAKAGVVLCESVDWEVYWSALSHRLREAHGVDPVHNVTEMRLLASRFPKQIRLFTASLEGEVVAGVVVYLSRRVAHAQYICATDDGLKLGGLDALFEYLIDLFQESHRYFDFGISTEQQGRVLNEGLILQKEGFGGGGIVHATYTLPLS